MAQIQFSFLLLLLLSTSCFAARLHRGSYRHSRPKNFVEAQCAATRYPELCVRYLSEYTSGTEAQSPQHLAQVALSVGLVRAQYTKAYVTKVAKNLKRKKARDYQPVKECLDQISDGVDQLSLSIKELRRIDQDGEDNFIWHTSNVQTWLSTALTDSSTCVDGISGQALGGKVKAMIKAKVLNVEQATSIALALFNRFAARHKAASGKP